MIDVFSVCCVLCCFLLEVSAATRVYSYWVLDKTVSQRSDWGSGVWLFTHRSTIPLKVGYKSFRIRQGLLFHRVFCYTESSVRHPLVLERSFRSSSKGN